VEKFCTARQAAEDNIKYSTTRQAAEDNIKYSTTRQAAEDNIKRHMRIACWITKTTDTYSE